MRDLGRPDVRVVMIISLGALRVQMALGDYFRRCEMDVRLK